MGVILLAPAAEQQQRGGRGYKKQRRHQIAGIPGRRAYGRKTAAKAVQDR